MDFFRNLFRKPAYPRELQPEVNRLTEVLAQIGRQDDFLSERPGAGFNGQCHNIRARQIGVRLHEIGGQELMQQVSQQIRKKLGAQLSAHLDYCWNEIGGWVP